MKYARFIYKGFEKTGIVEDNFIIEIEGSFFSEYKITEKKYNLCEVRLLPPCKPSKVIAVGLNYYDHIKEFGDRKVPDNPTLFVKLPHTIIGPLDKIIIPKGATRVDYEAELAVVIKERCYKAEPHEVIDYLLGATCLNDVTERHIQKADGQWIRGKNFETFCPIGPFIVNDIDYNSLDIKLLHNGVVKQNSNTSLLIWNVYELVSFISHVIPLEEGDIVTTGTPSGVGSVNEGDVVEVVIEGIGTLRNEVGKASV